MALHSTPEKHEADPPAAWQVVKTGPRNWELRSSLHRDGDGAIGYYSTKHEAEAGKTSGTWVALYEKEGRWFAGQTPAGWRPWADVKAEQDRREHRNSDGYRASVAQLAGELSRDSAEENSTDGTCGACGYPVQAHRGLFAMGYDNGGTFGVHLHRGCAADVKRAQTAAN